MTKKLQLNYENLFDTSLILIFISLFVIFIYIFILRPNGNTLQTHGKTSPNKPILKESELSKQRSDLLLQSTFIPIK